MSGVSLSRSDPCGSSPKTQRQLVMGSLRVIELQLVAFIMVFSASGLVPVFDLAFPVFTSGYLLLLSRLVFRPIGSSSRSSGQKNGWGGYVILGTIIGLFLALAYVLGRFARGDEHSVESEIPPLFLLSCQILTENIISGVGGFSPPVRALVPMLYTVRRIFVIFDWVQGVWIINNSSHLSSAAEIKDVAWVWFGRGLAVANLSYFSINLFCFLIPGFLSEAFNQYLMDQKINYDQMERKKQLHPSSDRQQQQDKNST
ncbi:hypothetical protein E3N88_03696 [Mikania micrantha]|uniref:DUF7733 domain-containing protein n=1 Tax=Mikania micrantha TaxID=192012 RepID=A0A5N6PUB8_9ASTR|nr:hypothetical protein E3N88_03696 [Mikania micrantha]